MRQAAVITAGDYLRLWRQRRRLSQLDLALEAEVSQRHLSFIESGRASPSRDMLLHLAGMLDVPLRERNAMLLAAGFAPAFPEHGLNEAAMAVVRAAVERVLKAHEPFPALAVDRHWTLVLANAAVGPLLDGVEDASLLQAPVNVLRLSLHPKGLAPRIANLAEWRGHLLERLRRQAAVTGDATLAALWQELQAYPAEGRLHTLDGPAAETGGIVVPLRLATGAGMLDLISTTTVFGTPRDVTLSELAVEAFFPADAETAARLRRL
ncbi:helix-turn-helix domain-containing protein [Zavarzinia sp.]|uniref:helix-turn-helix domain-containing protein n=1 Tax=Zavarzinia sp. TaxID=2027920 RepID=UPI00356ACC4E